MTVDSTTSTYTFTGNGAATTFSTPFALNSSTEVNIYLVSLSTGEETLLTSSDYSIPVSAVPAIAVITYPLAGTPMPATYALRVERATNTLQSVSVTNQTGYNAAVVMQVWDKLARVTQEQAAQQAGALRLPQGSTIRPIVVPATGIAGKTIVFNAAGDGVEIGPALGELEDSAASAASSAAAAAQAALDTAADLVLTNTDVLTTQNAVSGVTDKVDELLTLGYLADWGLITDAVGTTADYGSIV